MEELLTNFKLYLVNSGTDEDEISGKDAFLSFLLTMAGQKIIERLYPFDDTKTVVPIKYQTKQIEIAVFLFDKKGAEGEVSHNENGVNRTYENADVPDSLMRGIVPYCGFPIVTVTIV